VLDGLLLDVDLQRRVLQRGHVCSRHVHGGVRDRRRDVRVLHGPRFDLCRRRVYVRAGRLRRELLLQRRRGVHGEQPDALWFGIVVRHLHGQLAGRCMPRLQ
jgi:hypothetical protein